MVPKIATYFIKRKSHVVNVMKNVDKQCNLWSLVAKLTLIDSWDLVMWKNILSNEIIGQLLITIAHTSHMMGILLS